MEQDVILSRLLDKFENSKHLTDPGSSNRRVMLRVGKNELPEYRREDAAIRDRFNRAAMALEREGLIRLEWISGQPIFSKVILELEHVERAYNEIGRLHPQKAAQDACDQIQAALSCANTIWICAWRDEVCQTLRTEWRLPAVCKKGAGFLSDFLRVLSCLGIYARLEFYQMSGRCSIIMESGTVDLELLCSTGIGIPSTAVEKIRAFSLEKIRRITLLENKKITRNTCCLLLMHSINAVSQLRIPKTCGCAPHDPLPEKLKTLERLYETGGHSVRVLCEALDVPRGTFYNHIFRNKRDGSSYEKRREELRGHIRKVFEDSNQIFGAAKIVAVLREQGVNTTIETVRKLMREMGLASVRNGAKKQYEDESRKTRNIVKRNFQVDRPNAVWVSDVTFFQFNDFYYCICIIMDLYARKIISHRVGTSNSTQLVKSTFREAYESRNPGNGLIFHSDQGSNYRSRAFRAFLAERGVTQSFSNPGSPYDNSVAEPFFSSLKSEELCRYKYRSEKELREGVARYIRFYNSERPHKSLNYKTPNQKEREYWTAMEKS